MIKSPEEKARLEDITTQLTDWVARNNPIGGFANIYVSNGIGHASIGVADESADYYETEVAPQMHKATTGPINVN